MGVKSKQLAEVIRTLSASDYDAYQRAYLPKSEETFAALTYVLGAVGAQHLYLGQSQQVLARWCLMLLAWTSFAVEQVPIQVAAFIMPLLMGWWLYDIVAHARIVERANWKRKEAALQSIGRLPPPDLRGEKR